MPLRRLCFSIAFGLALGLSVAPALAAGIARPANVDPVTKAREYVAAGDMSEAIVWLQDYTRTHGGDVAAHRFLGDLYFRIGEIDQAAAVYEDILRENPFDKETHNRLGTVYAEENRVDAAIKQFEAALPGTDSVNDLVELHRIKGDLGAYEGRVEQLAYSFPGDADVQAELGQLRGALHENQKAVVAYFAALNDDPDDLTALNGLGLAYLDLHQYDESISTFQRCLHVDTTIYQCQNNLGAALLEDHKFADAKVALDRAFHLEPEKGETFVNFGYLDDSLGQWQKAAAEYGRAMEIYPYLREAYIDLALDYERHGLYTLAQAVLIKGIASVHDDGRLHVLLGEAYEAQGNSIDALTQFRLGLRGTDPTAISIATEQVNELSPASTTKPL